MFEINAVIFHIVQSADQVIQNNFLFIYLCVIKSKSIKNSEGVFSTCYVFLMYVW